MNAFCEDETHTQMHTAYGCKVNDTPFRYLVGYLISGGYHQWLSHQRITNQRISCSS